MISAFKSNLSLNNLKILRPKDTKNLANMPKMFCEFLPRYLQNVNRFLNKILISSASNSHSIGDKTFEGKNGQNHSQCRRPMHGGGEAHLRLAPLEGHDLQADEQVVGEGHARAST